MVYYNSSSVVYCILLYSISISIVYIYGILYIYYTYILLIVLLTFIWRLFYIIIIQIFEFLKKWSSIDLGNVAGHNFIDIVIFVAIDVSLMSSFEEILRALMSPYNHLRSEGKTLNISIMRESYFIISSQPRYISIHSWRLRLFKLLKAYL